MTYKTLTNLKKLYFNLLKHLKNIAYKQLKIKIEIKFLLISLYLTKIKNFQFPNFKQNKNKLHFSSSFSLNSLYFAINSLTL